MRPQASKIKRNLCDARSGAAGEASLGQGLMAPFQGKQRQPHNVSTSPPEVHTQRETGKLPSAQFRGVTQASVYSNFK